MTRRNGAACRGTRNAGWCVTGLKTTIKEKAMATKNGLPPVHPGEIIKQDILPSAGLSVTAAAKALGVSRQMLHDILAERKPLSAVMCLRVSRLFGGSPEIWMRLQAAYDLKRAELDKQVMRRIARIVPVVTPYHPPRVPSS